MKLSIFITLLFSSIIFPQNLDSLFNEFANKFTTAGRYEGLEAENQISGKCGFGLVAQIRTNLDRFSTEQKAVLTKALARFATDRTVDSPSGKFKVHYDTSGINAPDFDNDGVVDTDLNWLLLSADSVYEFEVNQLGYKAPPEDGLEGGDNKYDIYIRNIGDYGYTEPEASLGDGKWTSFLVIDNDFKHTYSKGKSGARVTIAHEFHHAIQIGSYFLRDTDDESDRFYYEISSTAMEEFMYDDVNDYYNYMRNYFNGPDRKSLSRMSSGLDGYDLAIWNIFLANRYDMDLLKRIWELMPEYRAMNAIALAIQERNSTFKKELQKFALWTYFTGSRAIDGEFFEEASNYPLVRPLEVVDSLSNRNILSVAASNSFLELKVNSIGEDSTLTAIISNSDVNGSLNENAVNTSVDFIIQNGSFSNSHLCSNDLDIYAALNSDNSIIFSETYIYKNTPLEYYNGILVVSYPSSYPYPQPFRLSQDVRLFLPVDQGSTEKADLYVYDINMNLIYSGEKDITTYGDVGIRWNLKADVASELSTGVYIYVIKCGDKITKGKIAVIND